MLVRGAYSKTINRPEFRELAPFSFYDFEFTWDRVGNPDLKTADIHNVDLRWEYYPTPAEVVSVGIFYKNFRNPIETTITTGADNPIFVFNNAAGAMAYGAEIEIRKSLASITSVPFINNLSLIFNGSLIRSEIDLGSQLTLTEARTRPLQGQSPYVINTGVYYQDPEAKWQVNLMYNVYGPRIFSVGDNEFPTIFEMPRNLLDLSVARRFGEKIEVRFGIADLLNTKVLLREDGNLDGKINNNSVDKPILQTRNGQYGTLGFTYKF
jgi:outer membrane receptor protein involved in Fe transport